MPNVILTLEDALTAARILAAEVDRLRMRVTELEQACERARGIIADLSSNEEAEVEQLRAEVERLRKPAPTTIWVSPFVITTVAIGGTTLKFRKPLVLNPVLDESRQLIVLEHSDLGIHVFARTRCELYDELVKQIGILWNEYVREDQAALDAKAIELRSKLTELIEEVTHE